MKWLDFIKGLIADTTISRESILLLTDIGYMVGKLSADDKAYILNALNITTYDINALIDGVISIYETETLLDEDIVNLALTQYVRKNIVTAEKRTQILSQLIKK